MDFVAATATSCQTGECPVWDDERDCLWFVDIPAACLFSFCPSSGVLRTYRAPGTIGALVLTDRGRILAGLPRRLALFDPEASTWETLVELPAEARGNRLNDGICDQAGRMLVGSMSAANPFGEVTGRLYRIEGRRVEVLDEKIHVNNSLGLSPDGRTLYRSDTVRRVLWRQSYGDHLGPVEVVDVIESGLGPDGLAVDAMGDLWLAVFGGGHLLHLDASGCLKRRYPVPAENPTMPCFGGKELRTLYLTTARFRASDRSLAEFPDSGAVLCAASPVAGRKPQRFREVG